MAFDANGELESDIRIWRYMDVGRFLALLKSRSLYFAKPHEFPDSWEALQLPRIEREILRDALIVEERRREEEKKLPAPTPPRNPPETISKQLAQVWDNFTRLASISCWHQNDAESIAMWKLYTSGAEGVAIQTTVGRLKIALEGAGRPMRIAAVRYIDHQASDDREPIERTTNPMLSALSKREVFSHEREIRVVIDYLEDVASRARPTPDGLAPEIPSQFTGKEKGENLLIDLDLLVERIVVSPDYPQWALSVLQDAVDSAGFESWSRNQEFIKSRQNALNEFRARAWGCKSLR